MKYPKHTAARIDERLIPRIGIREWGLPTLCCPGKLWRSVLRGTITCMTEKKDDPDRVEIETLPLHIMPAGSAQWLPSKWRDALWSYVQEWPHSGCGYGPFLQISEEQRCDFIRKLAAELVKSDNIGCCSIADSIGQFAAYGYELADPPKPADENKV